jgi:hypothetical protein
LAPVAAALIGAGNLSGFDYRRLEQSSGPQISWYNAQFYNGWGDARNGQMYRSIIAQGWPPNKVVLGLLTNPSNGSQGYVSVEVIGPVLATIIEQFPTFGGVMGWEYFNSLPGDTKEPWQWAAEIALSMGMSDVLVAALAVLVGGGMRNPLPRSLNLNQQ